MTRLTFICLFSSISLWNSGNSFKLIGKARQSVTGPKMMHESLTHLSNLNNVGDISIWAQYAAQGLADAAQCPAFGQPGWAPFCFLQGNPVFNSFDTFQAFVQNSVINLHDLLTGWGLKDAYGPSIILFTFFVRALLFPLTFQQLLSTQKTQSLSPKLKEIKEKYPDDQNLQGQMTALLYQETKVNPLAGCLPALVQLPVFLALYRSFQNLALQDKLRESFLWLPDLEGPVYGTRSADWILGAWPNGVPPLGWEATAAFVSIPILLVIAQTVSLKILTPPSDDPAIQRTQRILQYLPLMLGYFSLSVPAGLGVYWITNSVLSTVTTAGIKEYFKRNPFKIFDIDLDKLANSGSNAYMNPAWGYTNQEQMFNEARLNLKPSRKPRIPADFV